MSRLTRRDLLAGMAAGGPLLLGGQRAAAEPILRGPLYLGEWLSYHVHRTLMPNAMAREYSPEDMSPDFRTNGTVDPDSEEYRAHLATKFANWKLKVYGLVETPLMLSLADLRSMPSRTQITRHDCVEGWSAIGQWTGVPLRHVLEAARLRDSAQYIVFYCADALGPYVYYESIDLNDAFHPQTILAYGMNGADLPKGHGAPIRLRVERQIGYKHAKFVMRVEAVETLTDIYGGKGGFWQDLGGYEWYAGI